jgi:hypothetical protein
MYESISETNQGVFEFLKNEEIKTGKIHSRLVRIGDVVEGVEITKNLLAGFRL